MVFRFNSIVYLSERKKSEDESDNFENSSLIVFNFVVTSTPIHRLTIIIIYTCCYSLFTRTYSVDAASNVLIRRRYTDTCWIFKTFYSAHVWWMQRITPQLKLAASGLIETYFRDSRFCLQETHALKPSITSHFLCRVVFKFKVKIQTKRKI